MNEQDLKHILARNPAVTVTDYSGHNNDPVSKRNPVNRKVRNAEPERDAATTLDKVAEGEEESRRRTCVSFTGHRIRLLDPDNFAGSIKDLLDWLRQSHIILDDSPEHIVLHTAQTKVKTRKEERTEIVITYPNELD